jgi:hypothetical protein
MTNLLGHIYPIKTRLSGYYLSGNSQKEKQLNSMDEVDPNWWILSISSEFPWKNKNNSPAGR